MNHPTVTPEQILHAHRLYCELTGQTLCLGFDRERLWYELLRLGYGPEQLQKVIRYLQREIRQGRRNVGALKLSNLLQPDRFEEDLNISRVQLTPKRPPPPPRPPPPDPQTQRQGRQRALECLQQLKAQLGFRPTAELEKPPPAHREKKARFGMDEFEKIPTE